MKWLLDMNVLVCACAMCFALCPGSAGADDNPFVGRWHWDKAQSVLPPGEPPPADMMAELLRVDSKHVRWSVTVTDDQGKKDVESFDAPANGEFYPISSGTTASFRLEGGALEAVFKGPANETDTLNCTVSADRNKMTCKGRLDEAGGKVSNYVDVYERK